MVYRLLPFPIRLELLEAVCGVVLAALLLGVWGARPAWIEAAGAWIRRVARRRVLWIVVAAALGPGIRLAVLPIAPFPWPVTHDEFVHLLTADTLLHGRLANPPLPFPDAFATIYVLQRPTYASTYPLGNGAFLAIGWKVFGHPWFGVCLAMMLCCACVAWMAYRWLSPTSACAAALLFSLYLGVSTDWMNTYWGGSVAAAGGALVFGAIQALRRTGALKFAAILGAGWTLLWFTRPYESAIAGAIVAVVLLRSVRRMRFAIALLATVVATDAGVFCYHNFRVTGDALTSPYGWSRKQLGVPQSLLWQKAVPEPAGLTQRQHQSYLWQLTLYRDITHSPYPFELDVWRAGKFFVGLPMALPFLLGVLSFGSRKNRFLLIATGVCVLWSGLYFVMFPHYIAALTAPLFAFTGRGLTRLALWRPRGIPAGACLAFGLWCGAIVSATHVVHPWIFFGHPNPIGARNEAQRKLEAEPGRHLVFVRYTPDYNVHDEWVYNRADVDAAKVVWVNDLGPRRNAEVRNYFAGRTTWLVEPAGDKNLKPYDER